MINKPKRPLDKPPYLPLQNVYEIDGIGTVLVGRVEVGAPKSSMVVTFSPSKLIAEFRLDEAHHQSLLEAMLGDKLSFNVKNVVVNDVECGLFASRSKD